MASKRRLRRAGAPRRVRLSHWRADGEPKTRYRTQADAERAALQYRLEHGRELNSYSCEFCSGWHLGTSDAERG